MKAENLSNEDLAEMLRSICITGICPSRDEKEYLQEAADRLEQNPETVTEFADRCRECGAKYGKLLKQKSGKWIYDETLENWRCSKCNETPKTMGYVGTADFMAEHFKFCNHCGAKMFEPQESEE